MAVLPDWLGVFGQDIKYVPYPNVFISQRRWEDELPKKQTGLGEICAKSSEEAKKEFYNFNPGL